MCLESIILHLSPGQGLSWPRRKSVTAWISRSLGSREKGEIKAHPRMAGIMHVLSLAEERVKCEPEQSQSGGLGLESSIMKIRIIIMIAPTVLATPDNI